MFFFILLFGSNLLQVQGPPFAGPYEILFISFYRCQDMGDETITYGTRFSKINRTTLSYTGNITYLRGFTDSQKLTIDVSVFGKSGGWVPNYFNFKFEQACSDFKKIFGDAMSAIYEAAGYDFTHCPIPSGTYSVRKWVFSIKPAMKAMPYNKYKVETNIYENSRKQTCFTFEIEVVPIQKRG